MTRSIKKITTALHYVCSSRASLNAVMKMLIDLGGKELVVAKDEEGNTALHDLCIYINRHGNADNKIKIMLQVADTETIFLTEKNWNGKTPLDIATMNGASDEIKALLQPRAIKNEPEIATDDASNLVPDDQDNATTITELKDQLQAAKQKIIDMETQKTEHQKTIADLETEIVLLHEQNAKQDEEKVELQADVTSGSVANARRERDVEDDGDADQDQDDSSSHAQASKRSRIKSTSTSTGIEMDVEEDAVEEIIQELLHEK